MDGRRLASFTVAVVAFATLGGGLAPCAGGENANAPRTEVAKSMGPGGWAGTRLGGAGGIRGVSDARLDAGGEFQCREQHRVAQLYVTSLIDSVAAVKPVALNVALAVSPCGVLFCTNPPLKIVACTRLRSGVC
jgi:hypothetical protein